MARTRKTVDASKSTRELELEAQLKEALKNQKGESAVENKIQLDELIPVISLLSYPLNLSTREKGQGKVVKFDSFGQVKRVLYADLLDILEVSRHFMEAGYYLILDERIIRAHGLGEIYAKLLNKDSFEKILSNSNNAVALYKSANPEQQRVLVTMMIEKLRDDPNALDLNLVDQISRLSGTKIMEEAEYARQLFNTQTPATV